MTDRVPSAQLRAEAVALLGQQGYEPIAPPFFVGRIEFQTDGLFSGPSNSLGLALLLDGPTSREESGNLYWLAQRLVRALDAEGSRRSVTVILVGGNPDDRTVTELQTIARVLLLDGTLPTSRMLAPMVRLSKDQSTRSFSNGLTTLAAYIDGKPNSAGLATLLHAAPDGQAAVEDSLRHWIDLAVGRRQ